MEVVLANKSAYDNKQFLRFNTITLVPYERSLIDNSLLTTAQINTIDQYHAKVAEVLEPLLVSDESALKALRSRTANLNSISSTPGSSTQSVISTTSSTTLSTSSTTSTRTSTASSTGITPTLSTTSTTSRPNKTLIMKSSPFLITVVFVFIILF
jgi:hypothetical protein